MRSRLVLMLTAAASVVSLVSPGHAAQGVERTTYTGGGALVAKQSGQAPVADTGLLTCSASTGQGIGGGCVSFGSDPLAPASVQVLDAVTADHVAFQVCLDNNGDGACVSPDRGPCADQIFFSHNDEGLFFNPLGPLPSTFKAGCPGGPWRGYVVFLCTGAHEAGGGSHAHPATEGSITVLPVPGSGFGNFCGGSTQDPSNKRYIVTQ